MNNIINTLFRPDKFYSKETGTIIFSLTKSPKQENFVGGYVWWVGSVGKLKYIIEGCVRPHSKGLCTLIILWQKYLQNCYLYCKYVSDSWELVFI